MVNSPGPDFGAAGGGAAATGALETGALAAGDTGLENIRVNSPGPDCAAGAPGLDSETGEGGETGLPAAVGIPVVGSFDGFSIATGLKTRATSFVRPAFAGFDAALDPALPPAAGTVSACSMRVNSPGPRDASGPAAGTGAASFTGSAPTEITGDAEAPAGFAASASSAFFSGIGCPSSEASKSSSARAAACTCPKTPVALDGRSVLKESGWSKGFWGGFWGGFLGASMRCHLACYEFIGSGFQHYIGLA